MACLATDRIPIPIYPKMGNQKIVKIIDQYELNFLISTNHEKTQGFNFTEQKINFDSNIITIFTLYEQNHFDIDTNAALFLLTSGTTNLPKCVQISMINISFMIKTVADYLSITEKSNLLLIKNLTHVSSIIAELLVGIYTGATMVFTRKLLLPRIVAEIIEKHSIDTLFLVPSIFGNFEEYFIQHKNKLTSLKYVHISGEICSYDRIKVFCNNFPNVRIISAYGQTESCPRISTIDNKDLEKYKDSAGKPIDGIKIRILDNKGQAPLNSVGEIVVKGPNVSLGYYKDISLTEKNFKNGWLYTGDLGYIDETGNLFVLGRKDNLIIISGKNIYPEEIEKVILSSGYVKNTIVSNGEKGVSNRLEARVLLKQEFESDSQVTKKIQEFCSYHLEDYKVPLVKITKELPTSLTGKIKRGV
jgi:long-chain acyl-CoA synthetase